MNCLKIEATDISDAWFQSIRACVEEGYEYKITSGSYAGQRRRQLYNVTVEIRYPGTRPLAPIIPTSCSFPPPTSDEKIEEYFANYLMSEKPQAGEQYIYGMYIAPQLPLAIEKLRQGYGTNQACITLGDADSIKLPDPPCLKIIDLKIVANQLVFTLYFRSWDLIAGFPQNLGGLQLLKEFVISELGDESLQDGAIIAHSSGLHIYEHFWELAKARVGKA